EHTSTRASVEDSVSDSVSDSATTGNVAIDQAPDLPGGKPGVGARATDGDPAGRSASGPGSRQGSGKAREPLGLRAGSTASGRAGRKPRRAVGRPPGPERQAITVRVLAEHDDLLAQASDQEGMRPQQGIDAALREWFERHLAKEGT